MKYAMRRTLPQPPSVSSDSGVFTTRGKVVLTLLALFAGVALSVGTMNWTDIRSRLFHKKEAGASQAAPIEEYLAFFLTKDGPRCAPITVPKGQMSIQLLQQWASTHPEITTLTGLSKVNERTL